MSASVPVADLIDYDKVLEKVSIGSPVYLTRNGYDTYCIRDIKDEEHFQETEAMLQLMCELNAGIRSAENGGWVSEEEFQKHIRNRRNKVK